MATLPIFNAHIHAIRSCLGPHEKLVKRYPAIPRNLAEHLRKRRLDLGLTQEEAAQRFGISVAAYNGWEGGRGSPSIGKWPKIFDFLGYDPSPPPCNTFAEAVSALRRRLGLDKHQFAKQVDVDVKSVRNWESGRSVPLRRLREKLLALATDLEALVGFGHR